MAAIPEPIILASASTARAALLAAAGVAFSIDPAHIDEAKAKARSRRAGESAVECARVLAVEKARAVAQRHSRALVIGGDQLLVAGDEWFDKPCDLAEARRHLIRLRGRAHVLATAACVVRGGTLLWQATSTPVLTMRAFSESFLDAYIAAEGDMLLGSVGAYRLEGRGVQLFAGIDGDHFAILGLPLIELLEFLRGCGALPK